VSTRRTTVIVADDHVIVREGLVSLLREHDFEVLEAVGDGQRLIEAARRRRPDVIVTDISMPSLSGLDVLERLKSERVTSKIIVLTMHQDTAMATRAIRAGASGFVLKQAAGEELVDAIHQALSGHIYITPSVVGEVIEQISAAPNGSEPQLTVRQRDVLRLILEGLSIKEIATTLKLSARTIETHKYEMMQSLGVHSTAQLVKLAMERRLIVE
jgi:DNA-binding NarL/FixJ family response regulator